MARCQVTRAVQGGGGLWRVVHGVRACAWLVWGGGVGGVGSAGSLRVSRAREQQVWRVACGAVSESNRGREGCAGRDRIMSEGVGGG